MGGIVELRAARAKSLQNTGHDIADMLGTILGDHTHDKWLDSVPAALRSNTAHSRLD